MTTINKSLSANNATVSGISNSGGSGYEQKSVSVAKTGVGNMQASGGYQNPGDADLPPSSKATLTVNLSDAQNDSGFSFNGNHFRVINPGTTVEGPVNVILTKGQSATGSTNAFDYTFDGNNLTFTAKQVGEYYNQYRIADGYSYLVDDLTKPITYTAYTAFGSSAINTNVQTATNGTAASWAFDLSGKTVDNFSDEYRGKLISVIKYSAASSTSTTTYKFYDSKHELELESFKEDSGSRTYAVQQIDINDIRKRVEQDGLTLAAAVQEKIGGTVDGDKVKISSSDLAGEAGNNGTITLMEETLRHYDIDFSTLNVKMPDGLYGKGFRFYCATDNKEWFNFVFTDGTNSYDSEQDNIKSVDINISAVNNVDKLLKEIYNQAMPLLTGDDKKYNHHMRLAVDSQNKILTIYDHRRFDVSHPPYTYQEQGAKIADGVSFKENYAPERRNFSVKDLVIQHTDKAGMNLHIKIPQTTLDHIFDPLPIAPSTIFDYPVTSKESRDALLGSKDSSGILDRGLTYLLDAITLVGAQNKRLEFTATNVTTEMENLTASESTISDADMAKEMTEYTKANILAQTTQSMLAQANQSQSMVLSLLQ